MNYEERYNELIDAIKEMMEANPHDEGLQNWVQDNVPELAESDDERIRKALIRFHKGTIDIDGIKGDEIVSWLEKQDESKVSEPNWCHHKVDLSDCSEEYRKAYYDGWNNCNIQHSQCNEERNDVVKCLINGMKFYYEDNEDATWGTDKWSMPVKHIIEVLEKQGDHKSVDKVKPKFHEGDWIVQKNLGIYKIIEVCESWYEVISYNDGIQYSIGFDKENDCHLWSIEDAKPGDVLYCKSDNNIEYVVMNKGINMHGNIDSYFRYNSLDGFAVDVPAVLSAKNDNITLATREQCDLLFSKMKETRYEWDNEKKENFKIK